MSRPSVSSPLTFKPIFQERIWGGRKLAELFHKDLPAGQRIGESWEIVDRPEAQSIVANGPLAGKPLHELWTDHREEIFGQVSESPHFPLLIKLLDAQETLSIQVHPPKLIAKPLGGEPKTECWYVMAAEPGAELFVGFRQPVAQGNFVHALEQGSVAECVHRVQVKEGDAMFLPAGRIHAVGGGNVLFEIQENSDTTYRVFDWNRVDTHGQPRQLHVHEALQSIDFNDVTPPLVAPDGEILVRNRLFELQRWSLVEPRPAAPPGQFAIVCCLSGRVRCGDVSLEAGQMCLVPAALEDRMLHAAGENTTLLVATIPG